MLASVTSRFTNGVHEAFAITKQSQIDNKRRIRGCLLTTNRMIRIIIIIIILIIMIIIIIYIYIYIYNTHTL